MLNVNSTCTYTCACSCDVHIVFTCHKSLPLCSRYYSATPLVALLGLYILCTYKARHLALYRYNAVSPQVLLLLAVFCQHYGKCCTFLSSSSPVHLHLCSIIHVITITEEQYIHCTPRNVRGSTKCASTKCAMCACVCTCSVQCTACVYMQCTIYCMYIHAVYNILYVCTCSVQYTVCIYMQCTIYCMCVYLSTGVVHAADNSDCPLPDLLSGVPSIDEQLEIPLIPACIPSEQTDGLCVFEFPEGSVSYTDNTTNSIAFYNVSEAYCINSTMERKCEAGKWLDDVIFQEG